MLRKSRGAALSRAFLWLLLPAAVTAMQLPPEIQADRYLLQAERAIQEQDFQGAKTAMDGILELQEQHDLELPKQFFFRYAEVLERLGIYDEAINFVTEYLTLAGRDGEYYREALELLNDAEAAVVARRIAEEAERRRVEAAAEEAERRRVEAAAKEARRIAEEISNGIVSEGPYVDGQRHGRWVVRRSSGTVHEGPYVEGRRHGHWVIREADGQVYGEGPYVDGERHGDWTFRTSYDGHVFEGPYVDGERHGVWVEYYTSGRVADKGPYVDGQKHGIWRRYYTSGNFAFRARWVNGRRVK